MRVALDHPSDIETSDWETARTMLADDLRRLQTTINRTWDVAHNVDGTQRSASFGDILGQAQGTQAEQPTGLTIDNDGMLFFVTDFGHLVRWDGPLGMWKFAPGDVGNGFFRDYAITPQESGWVLCNGAVTTYLVVGGATLTTANFTTPNLSGSPAYKKSAAAYAGITGVSGATDAGTTGTGTTGTGTTSNDGATFAPAIFNGADTPASINTTAHVHSMPGLSIPGLSVPALGVGSIDMAHLNVLPYFRR